MIQSRTVLAGAAIALGLTAAALSAAASGGSARAEAPANLAAERIDVAFALAPKTEAAPAIKAAAAARTGKGDLLAKPACAGQLWPDVSRDCLVKSDGTAVQPVRSVTVGYQADANTTILIRMPAQQVASR